MNERDILFRGKRIDNGEWVKGNTIHIRPNGEVYIAPLGSFIGYSKANRPHQWYRIDTLFYEVSPESVAQYVGITDKNDTKIFDGDIVKTKFGRVCKVVFLQSPCFCGVDFIPLEGKHEPPDDYDLYLRDNLEIIGNIHDDPVIPGG